MTTFIDKLAWIFLEDAKILVTRSDGKDVWYLPGGKREAGESDIAALVREIAEELTVDLVVPSITPYGVFVDQAHGKPSGTMVRMTCYTAQYTGVLTPNQEIAAIDFFGYANKSQTSAVDHLIFDNLKAKGLIR